jgi:Putative adhesin
MSSQDMQFADPEWRPPEEREVNANSREQKTLPPRPINADRHEQPQWQTVPPPQEGYLGPGYAGSQPQTTWAGRSRPTPRRRGSPWLWIILAFIIIALMSGGLRGFGGDGPGPQNGFKGPPQSFTFYGASTIVINGSVGDINVHAGGSGNSVNIQETTDGGPFGNSRNTNPTPTQNGSTISVNVDQGRDTSFDVTVPTNENLQLATTDGSIVVDGINGQISLQSGSGDINVQDSQGPVSLQSNSGSITANSDVLTGSSTLKSDNGDVTFNGSIGSGNYQFQSNNGSVDVTLPSNSNFQVNASTSSGSINSDFSTVNIQSQGNGSQAQGKVGNASQAQVSLTSGSGDINLHKS